MRLVMNNFDCMGPGPTEHHYKYNLNSSKTFDLTLLFLCPEMNKKRLNIGYIACSVIQL